MKTPLLLAAALAGALSLPARGEDTPPPSTELVGSVMIEWTIANCGADGINPIMLAVSAMVLNGTPPERVEPIRQLFRQGVSDNYPDTEAACADLRGRMPQ